MKIDLVLEELHRSENELAGLLLHASERHKADHEIYHLARDLARWSQRHVAEIAATAPRYGPGLDAETVDEVSIPAGLPEKNSETLGRRGDASLLLLRDLRSIYVHASGVSVDWEMLAQAAQGLKDTELLDLAQRCHPDTLRQVRWANSRIKESSTQILVS